MSYFNPALYARAQGRIHDGLWSVDAERGLLIRSSGKAASTLNRSGYVVANVDPHTQVKVHRVIWESVHGPIPYGLVINHLNGVKTDNRLANLEVTTHQGNYHHAAQMGLRRTGGSRCIRGHEFTPESTEVDRRGWRSCRICRRNRRKRDCESDHRP